MKTLDEVTDWYANRKTILIGKATKEEMEDSILLYLKEYRHWQDVMEETPSYYEFVKMQNSWKEWEKNDPLTWDELKQMINSIVWLERSSNGNWVEIIYTTDDKIEYFCFGTDELYCIMRKDYAPDKWQAYRGEKR